MGKSKVMLSVNELKPGMILSEQITSGGLLLVGAGIAINNEMIKKLREKHFLQMVPVYIEDKVTIDNTLIYENKTIEDIQHSFNEVALGIKEIFDNIYNKNVMEMEELRVFSKRIQDELNSPNVVVKNIVLYGSGHDSIYRHSVNVAALSYILGKWVGFSEQEINMLTYSGILHDFGKTKIDRKILNKIQPLISKELKEIQTHPVVGYNHIKKIPYLDSCVSLGVLMHHERADGSGYPFGITEERIHKFGKIIAIADTFDAINSNRIYRRSKKPFEVLEIIQKDSLGKLDYEYCKTFLEHVINYYIGETVLLNTNRVCKIMQINVNDLSRPLLLDDGGFVDLKKETNLYVEKLLVE